MRRVSSVVGVAAALITTSFIVAPDMAAAATCGSTTLDVWINTPSFSCTVGDKTFSNFSYAQDGFNGTLGRSNVPATSVGVGPSVLTTAGPGLQFNANWQNTGTTSADAVIGFDVTAPANTPIADFHLLLNGLVGSVLDVATLNPIGVTLSSSDNLEHAISFAPVTFLHVTDDIGVNPGGSVSILDKQFSEIPGPVVGAGLPGLVMACGGLLGLARRRRRRTA
jgi:hypothetical protein